MVVASVWTWWQQTLAAGGITPSDFAADPTSAAFQAFINNPNRSVVLSSLANAQSVLSQLDPLLYTVLTSFTALDSDDTAPAYLALNKVANAWNAAQTNFSVLSTVYDELDTTLGLVQSYLAGK
jgi:hypothetical protein